MKYRDLEERLVANSVLSDDTSFEGTPCWIWIGARRANGYGAINIRVNGRHKSHIAHRIAYAELVGPIPEGAQIDHRCRVLLRINPAHLEAVTPEENIRRRDAAA